MLINYFEQLQTLSSGLEIPLKKIFHKAGIPSSTYYRTVKGDTQLSYDTSIKIANMIEIIRTGKCKRRDKRVL